MHGIPKVSRVLSQRGVNVPAILLLNFFILFFDLKIYSNSKPIHNDHNLTTYLIIISSHIEMCKKK